MKKIILVSLSLFSIMIFSSCKPNDTFEIRKQAAKQLLTKDCDFISNASTEFVKKHPLFKNLAETFITAGCDCITDSLAVQFANEYDLETIQNMEKQPIETTRTAVEKVLEKNNNAVKNCLFGN